MKEIVDKDFNLDISWLRDDAVADPSNLPEPEDLVSELSAKLETALGAINELALKLENTNYERDVKSDQ